MDNYTMRCFDLFRFLPRGHDRAAFDSNAGSVGNFGFAQSRLFLCAGFENQNLTFASPSGTVRLFFELLVDLPGAEKNALHKQYTSDQIQRKAKGH